MGRLVIEGDNKQLEVIVRENRMRASKYKLKFSIENDVEPKKEPKPARQQAKSGSDKTTGKK